MIYVNNNNGTDDIIKEIQATRISITNKMLPKNEYEEAIINLNNEIKALRALIKEKDEELYRAAKCQDQLIDSVVNYIKTIKEATIQETITPSLVGEALYESYEVHRICIPEFNLFKVVKKEDKKDE